MYNQYPPNMREIDGSRFFSLMSEWGIRQAIKEKDERRCPKINGGFEPTLSLFYFPCGTNIAIEHGDTTKFYSFGCDHKNIKITTIGRCLRSETCLDCGHSNTIDSSD